MSSNDTIAAIATPPGRGGIGILRVSGPQALAIGETICAAPIETGRIQFRRFLDADGEAIDHGLCLYFRAPNSYSGEDCLELQAHGGPIVLDMLLQRLCELGARIAHAGEFSERAFLNGRLDLAQAEAVADLIDSGSRAASRAAMRSLEGLLSRRVEALSEEIIALRVYIEAALDFAEEEIDFLDDASLGKRIDECRDHLRELLQQAEQGRCLQEGLKVSLAGLPNAGKSSLMNHLAGFEAAIVTDIEGTTRDVLREQITLRGIPVRISDTAGLRDTEDQVEREGVRRAWHAIEQADVVIYLVDSTRDITDADRNYLDSLPADKLQLVFSKSDLEGAVVPLAESALAVSVKTGVGIDELISRITAGIADLDQNHEAFMARRRHVDALLRALDSLDSASSTLLETRSGELVAEDLRSAHRSLAEITGEFTSEDLLGRIFSSFCIGK